MKGNYETLIMGIGRGSTIYQLVQDFATIHSNVNPGLINHSLLIRGVFLQ